MFVFVINRMNFKSAARKALLASKDERIKELNEALQAIEKKYADLESTIKSKNTEIDNLKSDLIKESQTRSDLESVIQSKEDQLNKLKSELDREAIEEEAAVKIQAMWRGHLVRQKDVEQLIKESEEMEAKQDEFQQCFLENEELKKEIYALKQVISNQTNSSKDQLEQGDLIQKLKDEVEALQKKCNELADNETLVKTCDDLKAKNKHLMDERKVIMAEYQNHSAELQNYHQQIPRLLSDIVQWKNRAMYLEQQLRPMEKNCMQELKKLNRLLEKHGMKTTDVRNSVVNQHPSMPNLSNNKQRRRKSKLKGKESNFRRKTSMF